MKKCILLYLLITFSVYLYCDIGYVFPKDIWFEKSDSGYDLYIKKVRGVNSLVLTESQRDPTFKRASYTLRTDKFYPANRDFGVRILDGKVLRVKYDELLLDHTTTENHHVIGEAFHFFLPQYVYYGYEDQEGAYGKMRIREGTRINLRLFSKKYNDYSGAYKDQWITLRLNYQKDDYRSRLVSDFSGLADNVMVKKKEDNFKDDLLSFVPDNIKKAPDTDVIFIIDTTSSMVEEFPVFRNTFDELVESIKKKVDKLNIGVILYRDYGEIYITKEIPLTENYEDIKALLFKIKLHGGQDIPEAVNEAVYALNNFKYKSEKRIAFLIGDAPSHTIQRGDISRKDALKVLEDKKITLNAICLPFK